MQDFRKLVVWEKGHRLTLEIYQITKKFPRDESFGLTSQLRRAVSSIPTNIAEGCGRKTLPDFARFLTISMGSASEVEYEILLAKDLEYIDETTAQQLQTNIEEIKRMLTSLITKIAKSNH